MIRLLMFILVFLSASATVFASEIPYDDATPRERVVENQSKANLRERWNPKAHEPASEESLPSEVSTERILEILKTDDALKDSPIEVKVTADNGVVRLEGVVNSEEEKALVGERAKIGGVKSVDNALTVRQSPEKA